MATRTYANKNYCVAKPVEFAGDVGLSWSECYFPVVEAKLAHAQRYTEGQDGTTQNKVPLEFVKDPSGQTRLYYDIYFCRNARLDDPSEAIMLAHPNHRLKQGSVFICGQFAKVFVYEHIGWVFWKPSTPQRMHTLGMQESYCLSADADNLGWATPDRRPVWDDTMSPLIYVKEVRQTLPSVLWANR
jgi:hypothetical protein